MFTRLTSLFVAVLAFGAAAPLIAADHAAITPYLTDDVVGIAYVDLEKVDFVPAINELARLNILPQEVIEGVKAKSVEMQAIYAELPKRGATRAYVLLRVKDVFGGSPTWVIETKRPEDTGPVIELVRRWVEEGKSVGDAAVVLPKAIEVEGALILGAESAESLKTLRTNRTATPRADVVAALAGVSQADVGVAIVPDGESRRVLREMFPQLPAPFMEINGALLADGIRWAGVAVTLPPQLQVSINVETTKPEFAATLELTIGKAMVIAKTILMKEMVDGPPVHQERARGLLPLLPLVAPKVEGTQLSIAFGDDEEEIAFMRDFVPAMTQKMLARTYQSQRMNYFKQIGLGMLNYESARGSFPAAASYDADGRPLLSWRVYVLPYMEQQALFNQFHLDEPWDSEHNRKLIDQMPDVFADPDPAVRAAIGDKGRTTFVVPLGEGLIFGKKEGMKFKELKDGSSNTILAVEVVPERAVVWTKPDDWEVDMANPLAGVARKDRNSFTAEWCDGHASYMGNDNSPEVFRSLLTPAGGEAIDYSEIK